MAAPWLWLSQWEWYDLSRLYQTAQRASIKTASSLRHPPHGFDLQLVVPAMIKCFSVTPALDDALHFIMAGVR